MSVEDLDGITQWHSASFGPCSFVVLTKCDNLQASEPHICIQYCEIKQVDFFLKALFIQRRFSAASIRVKGFAQGHLSGDNEGGVSTAYWISLPVQRIATLQSQAHSSLQYLRRHWQNIFLDI